MELFNGIGLSMTELALRTGVCERRVRYLHAGFKELKGVKTEVLMTYAEQVTLELLAAMAEAGANHRPPPKKRKPRSITEASWG